MVEFKAKADEIIKKRWGIEVEHVRANTTYEQMFYAKRGRTGRKSKFSGKIYGFPMVKGQWCLGELKLPPMSKIPHEAIQYLGIAADETVRIKRHSVRGFELPLVALGWTEADARLWCEKNNLLSPIYSKSTRGGVGSVIIRV